MSDGQEVGAVCCHDSLLRDGAGDPLLDGAGQYIELDQWLSRVVVVSGSGGVLAGGSAEIDVTGGTAEQSEQLVATGGDVCGGDEAVALAVVQAADGGLVAGGSAVIATNGLQSAQVTAQGGAVAGGVISLSIGITAGPLGGAVGGGAY